MVQLARRQGTSTHATRASTATEERKRRPRERDDTHTQAVSRTHPHHWRTPAMLRYAVLRNDARPPLPAASSLIEAGHFMSCNRQQSSSQTSLHTQARPAPMPEAPKPDPGPFTPIPMPPPAPRPVMCSKSVSTVDMSTMVAPLSAIQVEGQVSQLELTKLQSRHGAEHMQWKSEKDALLKQWQDELAVERQVAEGLRTELLDAQQQAAARAGELQVAVSALGDARRQLSARAGEVSQWRAEAARAVGKLETMTDHCERQNEQIHTLQKEIAAQRKALMSMQDASDLQHQALLVAEGARAEQSRRYRSRHASRTSNRSVAIAEVDSDLHAEEGTLFRPGGSPPPPPPSTPQYGTATGAAFLDVLAAGELRPPSRGR